LAPATLRLNRHTQLKIPQQIRTEDGTIVRLQNLHEWLQPTALFEIPSHYGKFGPKGLVDGIKRSDVWIDGSPE
jgi:hypothetical protein